MYKVLKSFPYSPDGLSTKYAREGDEIESFGSADVDGLKAAGNIEAKRGPKPSTKAVGAAPENKSA